MHLVFFGLSLSSSWGNGHATTYRGLLGGLRQLGHTADFFERDVDWYAAHRDLPDPPQARLHLYREWSDIRNRAREQARAADAVIVGSYFPDAILALDHLGGSSCGPLCFYDIDTPITLAALQQGRCAYLRPDQMTAVDLYLSFTGGPVLQELETIWGVKRARALYCACDETAYRSPLRAAPPKPGLSFLGTYAPDRQRKLEQLLLEPARRLPAMRFHVGGSMYPEVASWPANVTYRPHLPPADHPAFYAESRWTLNITRQAMVEAGFSPSVRLFEAAACGTAVISDSWPGLDDFFQPGREILVARSAAEVIEILRSRSLEDARRIGEAARARVLARHTCRQRARELEQYLEEAVGRERTAAPVAP